MKKLLIIALIISVLLLNSCNNISNTSTNEIDQTSESENTQTEQITEETTMFDDLYGLLSNSPSEKLTKENCDIIEVGMSYQEVVDIIGKPQFFTQFPHAKAFIWDSGDIALALCIGYPGSNLPKPKSYEDVFNYGIVVSIPEQYIPET